ncbi:uncharacterized protein B0I36DRAFT_265960 [Microdochium trichocladiopsis]|uniref:Uncharacterized protein n=1 Tax=Microdochium trichocladiopsis TaxID=1682393 RepID=A0A9P8Y8V8_9PEZI|nr:uncharacterized protein B0I36DRAFT_265960 [Microdochium trichocladiopsis]KAH7032930.1 hypothetical protein B0I36DRAFT_265960 [Microdochium trichocladiopsis]
MNSLWPSKAAPDGAETSSAAPTCPNDAIDNGIADVGPSAGAGTGIEATPIAEGSQPGPPQSSASRPSLQRDQATTGTPGTQTQPSAGQPADSLSLAQLRRLVSELPRTETAAYDFEYTDTGPHAEEIDEWFQYQLRQWMRLDAAQKDFESNWDDEISAKYDEVTWEEAAPELRLQYVRGLLAAVNSSPSTAARAQAIARVLYIVLGRWSETARSPTGDKSRLRSVASQGQLAAIKSGVQILHEAGGLPVVWEAFQTAVAAIWVDEPLRIQPPNVAQEAQDVLMNLMTIIYMCVQETINDREEMEMVADTLVSLEPSIATYMVGVCAKIRWQEAPSLPITQTLLLTWKSILLVFGGTEDIEEAKRALKEKADNKDKDLIMASPLDYHVFRQEITSKYPSYVPPRPPIPLEADNSSLLPHLRNHPTRDNGSNGIIPAPPGSQTGGASILHQPVHIATPAPSPPPSPAAGGKGGKKQNYQTNQNFPFMYPPLDATSNSAGGKGGAGLQELLVGRKWEGSDVPASVLEAGELFSRRVRMTRATRQLWEEREKFLKFERGWDTSYDDIDALDLDALEVEDEVDDDKLLEAIEQRRREEQQKEIDFGPDPNLDERFKQRLQTVEMFYESTLPQLQSMIIVLMKGVLNHVTACLSPPNGQQHPGVPGANGRVNGGPMPNRLHDNGVGINGTGNGDYHELSSLEDLDSIRAREIESKATTGIILLLLKWLKISHVLKFEYLTQLLLDSNYLPLVLKLFAHQDVQQVVDSKTDRLEHSFFHFCNSRAFPGDRMLVEPTEIDGLDDDSEDDAAPPPIRRRRSPTRTAAEMVPLPDASQRQDNQLAMRPEVDELGYPINPLPKEPITDFSRRNFFSLINYLRIMQKICKNKAHRNLLLVQYKSSNIIRKSLKIPQPELRLYTLKLFKNQVPYCGRKWRQSNMRVITAVYLHCRPELRDEWLAGSDVDAEVEEALPLEQALRSLTHWFNVRRYPDQMAVEVREALREEQDFFKRELDKLDWDEMPGESVNGDWEQQAGGMAGW